MIAALMCDNCKEKLEDLNTLEETAYKTAIEIYLKRRENLIVTVKDLSRPLIESLYGLEEKGFILTHEIDRERLAIKILGMNYLHVHEPKNQLFGVCLCRKDEKHVSVYSAYIEND